MSSGGRIPTPLKYRWRRFRYNALPVLCFLVCAAVTLWLWDKQGELPNAVGTVEIVRVDIAPQIDGRLVPLPELSKGYWAPFDLVRKDQVIARLDNKALLAQMDAFRNESVQLRKELESTDMKAALDEFDRRHDHLRERASLTQQVERYRLEILDRKTTIGTCRIELQRMENRLQFLASSTARDVITQFELRDVQLERDMFAKQIDQETTALREAEGQLAAALRRLETFPPLETCEVTKLLAPIAASIAVQESLAREVEAQIEAMEIRAPISGTISAIYYWPGQDVQAGVPILTIAGDTGPSIVTYIRQNQRIQPEVDMLVDVRPRIPGSRPEEVRVQKVGPQFEPIPLHLLRDPRVQEWGLPVRIGLPQKFSVRPGELIDVRFKTWPKEG